MTVKLPWVKILSEMRARRDSVLCVTSCPHYFTGRSLRVTNLVKVSVGDRQGTEGPFSAGVSDSEELYPWKA